ncbi:MAG: hypothetical protein VX438_05690 [Planctomycetota bacterium]|jgi:hypothetical protein|nr:hypothetical protein [Planctomycetota bacterium]
MKRLHQLILTISFIPFCWLAFMLVHELGHIVIGSLSGGTVTKVILHPLAISRTEVSPNPYPLLVVWAGPIGGVILPLLTWGLICRFKIPYEYLARFFAGFCLVANGVYIGFGSLEGIGDAGDLLKHGVPYWQLWLFGVVTIPVGFLIWNGLGPKFGLGESRGQVDPWAAYWSFGLLIALFLFSVLLSSSR